MEPSSKWNTHIIKRNTHQNGTLILSKGTLIKMEYSSKWNPHIIKIEPSYYQKEYSSKWLAHDLVIELALESAAIVLALAFSSVKWNE